MNCSGTSASSHVQLYSVMVLYLFVTIKYLITGSRPRMSTRIVHDSTSQRGNVMVATQIGEETVHNFPIVRLPTISL